MSNALRYDLEYRTMPWDDVDTVVFDIGNVLIRYAPDDFLLRLFPGDEKKQQDMLAQVYQGKYWPMFDLGTMEYEEAAERLSAEYGYSAEDYLHALRGWIELKTPIEEGWRAARLCKEKGKKIVLLSNYPREGYERMREKYADRFAIFDGGVISCYCHQGKPDDAIFETLMASCGVKPLRSVFIDDTLINVQGAIKNGIHGFHMHEKGMMDRFFL